MAVQNPPPDGDSSVTPPTDFHWAIPKISTAEKYFLSQLIATPSKDVSVFLSEAAGWSIAVRCIVFQCLCLHHIFLYSVLGSI